VKKGYVLVEGHGEIGAAHNLIARLAIDLELPLTWAQPVRWKNLHLRRGVEKGVEFIRAKQDAGALLLLRDEDDSCPRSKGPEIASWIRERNPSTPTAIVLLHPEFEVLFLPCLEAISGKPIDGRQGLLAGTRWDGATWETRRGVKEWLTEHMPPGRAYKPTLDQLPLTRMIDISALRRACVPCFGTLERALAFLGGSLDSKGVYPPIRT